MRRIFFITKQIPIYFLSLFIFLQLSNSKLMAFDYYWKDYGETYSNNIRVCHNDKASVIVDLPSKFLEKYKMVTLTATYESTTYTITKKHKGNSFYLFQPDLRLNDRSFFGNYTINIDETDSTKTYSLKVKTKYLNPGENKITFSYGWRKPKSKCKSSCCGYNVTNLYFEEKPILKQFKVSILSNPTGAIVNINKKHSSTTPFKLNLSKGYHTITIEKEGYDKFEGKIYIISDREISYDLESIVDKK